MNAKFVSFWVELRPGWQDDILKTPWPYPFDDCKKHHADSRMVKITVELPHVYPPTTPALVFAAKVDEVAK